MYVQPYPGPGSRARVSIDGGSCPAWSRNGRELFFLELPGVGGKRRMLAVDFTPEPALPTDSPAPLFEFDGAEPRFDCAYRRCYDVSADGQRFLVTRRAPTPPPVPVTHINIVENWLEELKAK